MHPGFKPGYLFMNEATPDKPLSSEAEAALRAFEAMRISKQNYFDLLQEIDEKYKNWGKPTDEEKQRLDALLEVHNEKVGHFNEAMAKVDDPDDRMALIQQLN